MKRIYIGITAVVIIGLMVIAGCKKKEEPAELGPLPPAPYKVGALFDLSGPAALLGEPERKTAEMIVKQINAAGGINGHLLKVIVEDTTGQETQTVDGMNKLVEIDRVCAVIGPSRSGTTMAIVNIAEEKKVPLVSCAAAADIVQPVKKWVFKVPQMDSDCARRIFDHMKQKGLTKAAIITATTGFGAAGRNQLLTVIKEYPDIQIVADETYGPKDTDMTVQLTKIKNTDAQALINWSITAGQSTVIKNARQLGLTATLYQSHGFGNIEYANAAGPAAKGVIFPAGPLLGVESLADDHPQKQVLAKYKKDYESAYNEPVSTFGGHGYDALHLVVEALKAVGPSKTKIRDYIENRKGFVGTAGVFNFSPEDHLGLDKTAFQMYVVDWDDAAGKAKFVPIKE